MKKYYNSQNKLCTEMGFFSFYSKHFFLPIKSMSSHKYDVHHAHNIKLALISLFIVMRVIKKPSLHSYPSAVCDGGVV